MDDQSSGLLPLDPSRVVSSHDDAMSVRAANTAEERQHVDPSSEAPLANPTKGIKLPLLISLHGIRTRGTWQKELSDALSASFTYAPLDFGFFSALKLLSPKRRRQRIDWFREEYTKLCRKHDDKTPCVIAHSLGSYIVARSMQIYPEIKFDRIILCGSIVHPAFPWSKLNEQFNRVLNDCGHADFWSKVVGWGVGDSGASGVKGFIDEAGGKVFQRRHAEFRHSDYFYDLNYEQNWIPFLKGNDPPPLVDTIAAPANWKFRVALGSVTLILLSVAVCVGWLLINGTWKNAPPPNAAPQIPPPIVTKEGLEDRKKLSETMFRKQNPATEAKDRKSREGLTEPVLRVDAPPASLLTPNDVSKDWTRAKKNGKREMAKLSDDLVGRSIADWDCVLADVVTTAQGTDKGVRIKFGDTPVTSRCYLANNDDFAQFLHIEGGTRFKFSGTIEDVNGDGLQFKDCRFRRLDAESSKSSAP